MFVKLGWQDLRVVLRDIGLLMQWSAPSFLVPLIFSVFYQESFRIMGIYVLAAVFAFVFGFALKRIFDIERETELKHAFLTVSLIWIVYSAFAAIPFVLITGMTFLDSLFEAVSALTTTGISVMVPLLDSAPLSLIFWRSFLSWIGGVGIIILALVGVLTTYTKSAKLTVAAGRDALLRPNMKNTIKEIWAIYVFLTIVGFVLLYFFGMSAFNSLNYSMSAISTTGMDTTTAGLLEINTFGIDISLMAIMLLGAIPFMVHYSFLKKRQFGAYFKDVEVRIMFLLVLASTVIIAPKMILLHGSNLIGLESALFHTISSLTCGGFAIVSRPDIFNWDDFIKIVLIGLMFIGGAAGSTAGGIKISRFWIFVKSIYWKIKEVILPEDSFFKRKFEGRDVENSEIRAIMQLIGMYAGFIVLGTLIITASGADMGNALFEVVSAQSNAGVSTGITHSGMPILSEIMLIINMLVGRLEIIPVLAAIGFMLSLRERMARK